MRGRARWTGLVAAAALALLMPGSSAGQAIHDGEHEAGLGTASPAAALGVPQPVLMRNKLFAPGVVTALVGEPVTWRNNDTVAHDVAAYDDSFDSGRLEPGATWPQAFQQAGIVDYRCTLHPLMYAKVKVIGVALAVGQAAAPGQPATVTGRAPAGTPSVTVERRAGDGTFVLVSTVQTAADGTFMARVASDVPTQIRARAGELSSDELRLAVSPRLELSARRARGRITLTVRSQPAQPGAPLVLQRYRRERFDFRTVASGKLGAGSTATFRIRSSHWERFRVATLRGVGGYGSARSRPLAVTVRRSGGHAGHHG